MIKEINNGILVNIKIVPNASKNSIVIDNGIIKIRVTAQPIENKANKALIELLSKTVKVPKSNIEIVKGETSKEKTILFKNIDNLKIEQINAYFKNL